MDRVKSSRVVLDNWFNSLDLQRSGVQFGWLNLIFSAFCCLLNALTALSNFGSRFRELEIPFTFPACLHFAFCRYNLWLFCVDRMPDSARKCLRHVAIHRRNQNCMETVNFSKPYLNISSF